MKEEEDIRRFEAEREHKVRRGRILVLYVVCVSALIVVFELSFSNLSMTLVIRNAILVLLLVAIWAGYPAARFVLAALFCLGGLMAGFLYLGSGNPKLMGSGAAIAALMVSSALVLTFSTSVAEFLDERRSRS
jgi:drug/metabolite transporter (DMT)-like permease